jgi:hypothetical protein
LERYLFQENYRIKEIILKTNNMNNSTAIEKLESLFYNEANPTINSNSWVIEEKTFKRLIEAAKAMEKEQVCNAYLSGDLMEGRANLSDAQQYYNETYK